MACTEKDEAAYCPKFICVKKAGFLHKRQLSYKNRDFKIQRRGRQRKRQKKKNNRFSKQNINFARASRFFVHFFSRFCTTTT